MQDGWMQCQYFALAYLLIMVVNATDFLFPTFGPLSVAVNDDDKVDSRVSKLWRDTFRVILQVYENYRDLFDDEADFDAAIGAMNSKLGSHHAKKGANVKMSDSPAAGFAQIFRTGWLVAAAHSVFDYIYGTYKMDTVSGKAIAGWVQELCGHVYGGYMPDKSKLVHHTELFPNFVECLFSGATGFCRRLLEILAMTVLVRYDAVVDHIKSEPTGRWSNPTHHPFVAQVDQARRKSHVSDEVFRLWKNDALNSFISLNKVALSADFSPDMEKYLADERTLVSCFRDLSKSQHGTQGACNAIVLCRMFIDANLISLAHYRIWLRN